MTISGRSLVVDTSRLIGANTVTRAVGIGALILYARTLAPGELAALPIFLLLGSFTTIPFNLGLYPTLLREIPRLLVSDEQQAVGMIRTVTVTIAGGVLLAGVSYALLSPVIAHVYLGQALNAPLILWMVPGTVARGWDEVLTFVMRATRDVGLLTSKKLVSEIGQPLLAVALLPALGVRGLILGQTLGLVAGLGWGVYGLRRHLFRRARAVPLAPLVRRSVPYYLEGLVFFVTQQGDQALVGAMMSPSALAAYYVARRIPDALGLILYSVEEIMGPTLSRAAVYGREAVTRSFQVMTMLVGALVLPAGVLTATLAGVYVTLVGRASYFFLVPAIVLLALATLAQGCITVTSQVALALGHPKDRVKITLTFAALLLAGTVSTAHVSVTAVAASRAAAMAGAALVGFLLTRELRPPMPWNDLARLILPTVVLGATMVGLQAIWSNPWLVPLFVVAACLVAGFALYFSLSPERRRLLLAELGLQLT